MKRPRAAKAAGDTTPDGILTLDPASTANCGLAFRPSGRTWTESGRLRGPEWYHTGSVWNPVMHDELTRVLARWVPRGGNVYFAATATAFSGNGIAIGRAIGCIEGILHDMNVAGNKVDELADVTWRMGVFPSADRLRIKESPAKERRTLWKELAVATVMAKYKIETDDNAAEAILMNDFVAAKLRAL